MAFTGRVQLLSTMTCERNTDTHPQTTGREESEDHIVQSFFLERSIALDAAPSGKGTPAKSLCIAERSGQVYFMTRAEIEVRAPGSCVLGAK
jgi:hypothetical protein